MQTCSSTLPKSRGFQGHRLQRPRCGTLNKMLMLTGHSIRRNRTKCWGGRYLLRTNEFWSSCIQSISVTDSTSPTTQQPHSATAQILVQRCDPIATYNHVRNRVCGSLVAPNRRPPSNTNIRRKPRWQGMAEHVGMVKGPGQQLHLPLDGRAVMDDCLTAHGATEAQSNESCFLVHDPAARWQVMSEERNE